ncbi:hypothetical protein GTQ40_14670 [Flavobacteriaceae bacterium R38]|nr:hypothetical protein [Flavobacteriaceae bacterium R38]
MKTYVNFLILFIALGTANNYAQSCPIPEPLDIEEAVGEWKGNVTLDGELKVLSITISESKGELTSKISIDGIINRKQEAKTKICSGEELHMELVINNIEYDFRGVPKNGKLSGRMFKREKGESSSEVYSLKKA